MLTSAENELLCRVGPGTPMGNLIRRYWIPAILPADLPEADCAPVRVRLLGEDLIAYRDTTGKVGLIQNACPHRGASLFFGRNEEGGLRCVYHGWKFDTEGNCVDMPNEPAESNFKHKIRVTAYPCVERGGVIWAYLGPPEHQPEALPEFLSNILPDDHAYVAVRVQESNFLQALEGGYDSSHASFLHARLQQTPAMPQGVMGGNLLLEDRHPRFLVADTDYGELIIARRDADAQHYYWRTNLFLMPFYHMSPTTGKDHIDRWNAWVPLDDTTTMRWVIAWHPSHAITEEDMLPYRVPEASFQLLGPQDYEPASVLPGGKWRTKANRHNDYYLDRNLQRRFNYTGIIGPPTQDQAITEAMGPLYDRTKEHIGSSDAGIIAARRHMLRAVKALAAQGSSPPGAREPKVYRIRAADALLPKDAVWWEATISRMKAEPGVIVEPV